MKSVKAAAFIIRKNQERLTVITDERQTEQSGQLWTNSVCVCYFQFKSFR